MTANVCDEYSVDSLECLNDFSVSEKRLAKRFVHMDIGASDSEAANVLSE